MISPLLANLFLHYVFDVLDRGFSGVPFERYADDIICHCYSEREALKLRRALDQRFAGVWTGVRPGEDHKGLLQGHQPQKGIMRSSSSTSSATPSAAAKAKWRGGLFGVSFLPAASPKALVGYNPVRRSGAGPCRPEATRSWTTWLAPRRARNWLARVIRTPPDLFAHWTLLHGGGRAPGAAANREVHLSVLGARGGEIPRATRLPLYRQAQMPKRQGITLELPDAECSGWDARAGG